MANRDDERQDGLLSKVAKAALVVGTGAAVFYRAGGSDILSDGLRRTSRALTSASNSISGRALSDVYGNGRTVINDAVKAFKRTWDESDRLAPTLRLDNPNSFFNVLQTSRSLQNDAEAVLKANFTKSEFIPNLKRTLQDNFDTHSPDKLNDIVDKLTSHMSDNLEIAGRQIADQVDDYRMSASFIEDELSEFSQEEIQRMDDLINKGFAEKRQQQMEYLQQHKDLINNIQEKLTDFDENAERFGVRGQEEFQEQMMNKILGDRRATIQDVIDYADRTGELQDLEFIRVANKDPQTVINELKELVDKDERWKDLYVDNTLRVDAHGNLKSFAEAAKMEEQFEEMYLHTTLGKISKPIENRPFQRNVGNLEFINKGTINYQIPRALDGVDTNVVQNNYVYINRKGYKIDGTELIREHGFDDMTPYSGRHGSMNRWLKNMTGDVDYNMDRGWMEEKLDVFSNPKIGGVFKFANMVDKFDADNWEPNILRNALDIDRSRYDIGDDAYFKNAKQVNRIFKSNTQKLDKTTAINLARNTTDEKARSMFNLLQLDDESLIAELAKTPITNKKLAFNNEDLTSLVSKYQRNPQKASKLISLNETMQDISFAKKEYVKKESYADMLRKEVAKEGFMLHSKAGGSLDELINSANLTAKQSKSAKRLASWAKYQQTGKDVFSSNMNPLSKEAKITTNINLAELLLFDESKDADMVRQSIEAMSNDLYKLTDTKATKEYLTNIHKANRPDDIIFVKKGINPLDIITANNKAEKAKAFVKQFTAGRNNMQDVTSYTMAPYFMLHRLSDAIPSLSFSPENTGSTLDLAKAFLTKRIVPAAIGITAFNYLNFETRNLTGKSFNEAFLTSVTNIDLGRRRIADTLGFTDRAKANYAANPLMRYLQEDEPRSEEEQRDYLANGYDPVRKGRWWGMSTSEFRGGKVEYFAPNILRQVSTPWKDISLYGSEDEKWKHSWLPTLRHPLSPIRNLLDPYYLEEKHKYDRPYPVTAPLFSEGTAWGGIGNATIGQLIKPQRRMHEEVLGNHLIDVRDLIAQENQRILDKASKKQLVITGSDTATEETNYNYGQYGGAPNVLSDEGAINSFNSYSTNNGYGSYGYKVANIGKQQNNTLNLADKVMMTALDLGMSMPQVNMINNEIKQKAYTRGNAQTNFAKEVDQLSASKNIDLVKDKHIRAELLNINSNADYIRDIGYSAKQLSGIYGFVFDELSPQQQRYRLENANKMSSFTTRFWDENLGGAGGGFMEIARRFFPHEDRNITNINTIRNTMPDWMPENFKVGDPYTKVSKGEMRLPGLGYEAINNYKPQLDFSINPMMIGASKKEIVNYYLHKDEMDKVFDASAGGQLYVSQKQLEETEKNVHEAIKTVQKMMDEGKVNRGTFYSDFERFKILADVAPYSQEYKEYKQKVQQNLNTAQRKEFNDILDRVEKQNKQHDFFNYQYIGFKEANVEGVIDTVKGNKFTLVGSNQTYSIAGVKLEDDEALASQLRSGMKVSLAFDALDQGEQVIKATVMKGRENVNRTLIDIGAGERDYSTAIDARSTITGTQKLFGAVGEIIGHAPIPFIHNRYLKLESARESYANEQVYGTPYATWSNPIQGYIEPAINKAIASGPLHTTIGLAAWGANVYINNLSSKEFSPFVKKLAEGANILATPGAFAGAMTGYMSKLDTSLIKAGTQIGSAVWAGSYLVTNAKNPIFAASSGASIGMFVGDFLEKGQGGKYAKTGALIGLGISAIRNPGWDIETMREKWIPKKTKKRWDMEEYFDRLEYIKYKGLYEKAARKALIEEGVDIKKIIGEMEANEDNARENRSKLLRWQEKISNTHMKNTAYGKSLLNKINNELYADVNQQVVLESSPYAKSAIAYKQAMDSTIYGLKEDASWAQILRALPKGDRDYFLEFAKVKDEKERKKILEIVSPYKRRVLQQLWGQKVDKLESNASYFSSHKLPSMLWAGWRPDVDMEHVKMKTIENEGMLLSDFGLYESASNTPRAQAAPGIEDYDEGTNILSLRKNLFTALSGIGLTGVEVSIEPSQTSGIQMITDFVRITDFQVRNRINSLFGRNYY